jgi:hypothetical protein
MTSDLLERRLEALAFEGAPGNWLDVVRRSERQRALTLRRRALIGLAAALLLAIPALALAYRFADVLVVSSTDAEPPVAWITGDRIFNLDGDERTLAAPLAQSIDTSMYLFDFSPATPSPDGRWLIYTAAEPRGSRPWPPGPATPVLRLHDLSTGRDRVLVRGGGSPAWGGDGALAYVAGVIDRAESRLDPVGHVFVRRSLSEPAVRWSTRAARYTAIAWARDDLLVAAVAAGQRVPAQGEGVYAFSGPGRARKLPLGGVVAVDPQGELVIGPETLELFFAGSLKFRVVRVRDGAILDELDLPPLIDPSVPYAAGQYVTGGSWAGDYIVVAASAALADALVLLRFDDGQLSPGHVFRLEPSSATRAGFRGEPSSDFGNPRFVDDEGDEIVAWATTTRKDGRATVRSSVFLVCSRKEKECRRTDPLPDLTLSSDPVAARGQFPPAHAFVENLSRPLPDRP